MLISTSPIKVKWSRFGGYEVSSKGDRRFSALNAMLDCGRTIEEIYQCDIKGYDPGGTNWRLGKGKPPLDRSVDLWAAYLDLWKQWALENPDLIDELRTLVKDNGFCLSDRFATTHINQAHALSKILNEGY